MAMPELAIEPQADRRYSIAICKGAGLVNETRHLLEHWRPGEDVEAFVRRVQEEDLLGRTTAYRTRDIARRVFARRFLLPTDRPARLLKSIIAHHLPQKTFIELLFLFACRADALLYDFTLWGYWETVRRGRTRVSRADVLAFFADAAAQGYIPHPWSDRVQVNIARGLLAMLRDVGLLREQRRGQQEREIIPFRMSDAGVACLARDLHEAGLSDYALCGHPDWGLFGLGRQEVVERFDGLGENQGVIIQRAGSVVSITWRVQSMEELLNVLAR